MANISIAKQAELRAAAKKAPTKKEYRIVDPHFIPDMRGELGGVKVTRRGTDQFVVMSDTQAKFYIDGGAIAPVS